MTRVNITCTDNGIDQTLEGAMTVGAVRTDEKTMIFAVGSARPEELFETLADAMVQLGKNIFKTDGDEEAERILWKLEKKILKKCFERHAEVAE